MSILSTQTYLKFTDNRVVCNVCANESKRVPKWLKNIAKAKGHFIFYHKDLFAQESQIICQEIRLTFNKPAGKPEPRVITGGISKTTIPNQ